MRVHILILQPHMSNGTHSNSDNLGVQPLKEKRRKEKLSACTCYLLFVSFLIVHQMVGIVICSAQEGHKLIPLDGPCSPRGANKQGSAEAVEE